MANKSRILSGQVSEDLYLAIHDRAESEGISISELIRIVMTQFVFGAMPSFDEGYAEAKSLAYRIARYALSVGFESMPATAEEALELARAGKL